MEQFTSFMLHQHSHIIRRQYIQLIKRIYKLKDVALKPVCRRLPRECIIALMKGIHSTVFTGPDSNYKLAKYELGKYKQSGNLVGKHLDI